MTESGFEGQETSSLLKGRAPLVRLVGVIKPGRYVTLSNGGENGGDRFRDRKVHFIVGRKVP